MKYDNPLCEIPSVIKRQLCHSDGRQVSKRGKRTKRWRSHSFLTSSVLSKETSQFRVKLASGKWSVLNDEHASLELEIRFTSWRSHRLHQLQKFGKSLILSWRKRLVIALRTSLYAHNSEPIRRRIGAHPLCLVIEISVFQRSHLLFIIGRWRRPLQVEVEYALNAISSLVRVLSTGVMQYSSTKYSLN
jgi:hypothetical protein